MSCVFDYYYGEESESCSFYRIPRLLIVGERFSGLSTDAKLLYGLMLDRMNLSARNGWYDDEGRVYIYYTLEEIQESMSCGHGNDAGRTALGGGNNAVNGVDHGKIPPKYVILLLFKAIYAPEPALFPVILYNIPAAPSTENRSIQ